MLASVLASLLLLTSCAGGGADAPSEEHDGGAGVEQEDDELTPEEQEAQEREQQRQEDIEAREAALAGPADQHYEQAAELVEQMNVAEQAGQVLIGEYSSTDVESAAAMIDDLGLAGVILMSHNIPGGTESVETEALEEQLAVIADAGGEDRVVPPIISVDQEGGLVTRVGSPLTEWPTPMAYGAAHQQDAEIGARLSLHGHRHMALELQSLGFTVSFAPTADVTFGAADPTIGSRSFGSDPDAVTELSQAAIRGLAEGGLAGSVKHFPGHGSVSEDSHYTLPVQDQSLEDLRSRDWVPFAETVEAGVPMVMMGHIDVPALDESVPSSLSEAAYDQVRQMGHEGVIVTDAMNMAAVVNNYGGDEAAVRALAAGADLLLMPSSVSGAHSAIISAAESGQLSEERLEEAAERVAALALWQQDLTSGELAGGPGAEPPAEAEDTDTDDAGWDGWASSAEEVAAETARRSLTMVTGECAPEVPAVQIAGGTEEDRERMAVAAGHEGIEVGHGQVLTLLGGSTPGSGDIVVALDRPEPLAQSSGQTMIATYGRTEQSFEALAQLLAGGEGAALDEMGRLPVPVGDEQSGHTGC